MMILSKLVSLRSQSSGRSKLLQKIKNDKTLKRITLISNSFLFVIKKETNIVSFKLNQINFYFLTFVCILLVYIDD